MLPETVQPKVTKKMSKLVKIGASEALNKAHGFKIENPSFRLIMSKTYVGQPKKVTVPFPFTEEYFPGTEGDITLQVDGDTKTWSMKYKVYTEQRRCQISNGWGRFVKDNKLQLNDLCVFELINKDPLTLKIFIFHETELGKSHAGELRFQDLFKSDIPFFHVVITSANLQEENMEIPKAFTDEHIRINIHNVKLQVGEIVWPMELGTSEGCVRQFSGGWIEFAKLLAPLVVGRKGINHDFTVVLKSRHLRTGNHLAVCEIINELQKAFDRVLFSIQVPYATTVSAILFVSITLCAAFARAKQNFNLAATSVVLCGQKQMAKE
ncbi:hypothetical protein ACFE04_026181 [Oxalis oulophora]